jgi:trehalose-6-phosphate synthase
MHIFMSRFITFAAMVFTTFVEHGAIINSFLFSAMIGFSTFSSCKMFDYLSVRHKDVCVLKDTLVLLVVIDE